jgi:hypothetical protein
LQALWCAVVIGLTAFKRHRFRLRNKPAGSIGLFRPEPSRSAKE